MLLRQLDGRAIILAALIAFVAPIPLSWLGGALAYLMTSRAETMTYVQSAIAMVGYFAAPFVGAAVAARFSRTLPLANGMTVALISGALAIALGQSDFTWFPIVLLIAALGAGALGAVIGRALRPNRGNI